MEYNVSTLLKSPVGTARDYPLEQVDLQLDESLESSIDGGHIRLDRTNVGILARGTVESRVLLRCVRCLEAIEVPVDCEFTEEFKPTLDVVSGRLLPKDEDTGEVFYVDEHLVLDAREAVRQNIVGSLPIKPLCCEDCAGLCPVCGVNRNEVACSCVVRDENRPLAALAALIPEVEQTRVGEQDE